MRRGKILLLLAALFLAVLSLPAVVPTSADAQPAVFRMVTAPLRMVAPRRFGHRARHHRQAVHARHRKATVARAARRGAATAGVAAPASQMADPDGQTSGVAPSQDTAPDRPEPARGETPRAEPAWVGPVYWPHASDDLFDYPLRVNGERFWAHGGRDFTDAILMRDRTAEGGTDLCGSRHDDANAWQEPIAQAVQPTDAQRPALDQLGSALADASKGIKGHCPAASTRPSPTQRLDAMMDRLWGMRQAVAVVRAPLAKFSDVLDEQQKARLTDAAAEPRGAVAEPRGVAAEPRDPPAEPAATWAQLCADPTAMAPWPNEQIERRLRPTKEQRQSLQTLQMTTQGMAKLLIDSCPKAMPSTAVDRLDAAEKRLNVMLYAARVVKPALHAFYDSLSPEQKTRFTALGGERRNSARGARSAARDER